MASAGLRKRGNETLTRADAWGLPYTVRRNRLSAARTLYLQAVEAAQDDADRASALKNAGVASARLAGCVEDLDPADKDWDACCSERLGHLLQAMQCHSGAFQSGQQIKDAAWRAQCFSSVMDLTEQFLGSVKPLGVGVMLTWLARALRGLRSLPRREGCSAVLGLWCRQHAGALLELMVTELDQGQDADFKLCRRLLSESYQPTELAIQAFEAHGDPALLADAHVLRRELDTTGYQVESMEERHAADGIVERQMFMELTPSPDLVWVAMDKYKLAVKLTRETDVEGEAIALSRIGRLYDKVLKNSEKATGYYKRVLELAETLKPRNVYGEAWCNEAVLALRRIQEERALREESAEVKRKRPFLEALAPELEALKAAARKGEFALLKFVYATHPPKNKAGDGSDLTLDKEPDSSNCKDLLKQALLAYHPDKQRAETHGESWCVLCGEVTVLLTLAYSHFTCCPHDTM